MPEPDNAGEKGLADYQLTGLFDRAGKIRAGMVNNDPNMYIDPKEGEIYIFDIPHGMTTKQAKHLISTGDPYVWKNNGDKKERKDGLIKNYLDNLDKDKRRTGFSKRMHVSKCYPKHVIVEYVGKHSTGLIKADTYYEEAVSKWKYQSKAMQQLEKESDEYISRETNETGEIPQTDPKI